jgi:hypothetical protein
MTFYCVNDSAAPTTVALLRGSCAARSVEFVDYGRERRLSSGDLLYRPAISAAAIQVEQFLFNEQVASFYRRPESIFFQPITPPLLFQYTGLPIPPTVYCSTMQRSVIRGFVEQLGGFPIVVKVLGYSSGIGVMRVDSYPVLFSLLDFALSQGHNPLLCAYIDQATHWRLIVLGDAVISAYVNEPAADDFRTSAPADPQNYTTTVRPDLAGIAVRAVQVLQREFGGVDLLEDTHGKVFLLEANFPCYFAHPQDAAGIDISGMMVEYLIGKANS